MLDFITIGGVTRDIFLKYEDLGKIKSKKSISGQFLLAPYGEKIVASESFYTYGGGAANSAICMTRLGAKVGTICNIGAEGTGSLVAATLKEEGVNVSMISRDKKHHTGLSIFILGKDNEHTGFLERGANSFLKIARLSVLKKTKWIYLSSLTGESADLIPEIFEYAKKHNIKIAFNPGSQQIKEGHSKLIKYLSQAAILILNMEEAEDLVKSQYGKSPKKRRELFRKVADFGAKISVITEGEDGSHAMIDGKVYSQKSYPKKVVDTTGSGDAFGATFAYAISLGENIPDALKMSAINAASVVANMGAQDGLLKVRDIRENRWL